ncbi:MAG: formylglycine-generating enzyme family protein [Limisphaerales bacterium]
MRDIPRSRFDGFLPRYPALPPTIIALTMVTLCSAEAGVVVPIDAFRDGPSRVRIEWQSTPGEWYAVESSTNLLSAWVSAPAQPSPLLAISNRTAVSVLLANETAFFQVIQMDPSPTNPDPDRLVWIPARGFVMGSPESEVSHRADEAPTTWVSFSQGFFVGRHEVTQREYLAVMGANPSRFTGDLDRPVERVSWADATNFCALLTERRTTAGLLAPGWEFRLPTEAQWEYACRAGTTSAVAFGDRLSSVQANFNGTFPYNGSDQGPYLGRTVPVGSYPANPWGLFDLHGNVWEWCLDWYSGRLPGGEVIDPTGAETGAHRVLRGGSWLAIGQNCRSAFRIGLPPEEIRDEDGFRVVLVLAR